MALGDDELLRLFRQRESEDRVERKASIADAEKICQAICAFANDLGQTGKEGVIFVGQRDDLQCAGLSIDDRLLETIGGWRSTGKFQPFPVMSVTRHRLEGCDIAVIVVRPSDNTPVRYDGRAYIRVGPRRAVASPEEERRLTEKRRSRDLPFDARGMAEATLNDLDLVRFKLEYLPAAVPADVLAENGRADTDQMRALRLIDPEGRPTVTAILVLGKRPQSFIPGAYVQILRINGLQLTDPIADRHELTGTVPDQIRRLDELGALWTRIGSIVGGDLRSDQPDYPIAALRQIFRNALMHRTYEGSNSPVRITWYDDRVETSSPGGVFGQVTPETFGRPGITDYRNPTLAEAMKSLGFAERFGVGLQIVARELKANGNPPADFEVLPNFVQVTVRRRT